MSYVELPYRELNNQGLFFFESHKTTYQVEVLRVDVNFEFYYIIGYVSRLLDEWSCQSMICALVLLFIYI